MRWGVIFVNCRLGSEGKTAAAAHAEARRMCINQDRGHVIPRLVCLKWVLPRKVMWPIETHEGITDDGTFAGRKSHAGEALAGFPETPGGALTVLVCLLNLLSYIRLGSTERVPARVAAPFVCNGLIPSPLANRRLVILRLFVRLLNFMDKVHARREKSLRHFKQKLTPLR